jgi:S1-C subfamily serine protease
VLLYEKLAFLSADSSIRTVIFALLLLAAGLLCYDMFATLGNRLRRKYMPHWHIKVGTDMVIGGGLAVVSYVVTLWLVAVMFTNAAAPILQGQLAGSRFLGWARLIGSPPALFTHVSHLLRPFGSPQAFAEGEPDFANNPTAINRQYADLDAAAQAVTPSVVKISSWGCGSGTTGTGFVVADRLIMTNAHVLAGAYRITVQDQAGTHPAQAVWFDPELDVGVLKTDVALEGKPLPLIDRALAAGDVAIVLGYAGGQGLVQEDATILELLHANGFDIYNRQKTVRNVYALRSIIEPGDSGAPLLDSQGRVRGLVFGNSYTQSKTGYAIAASEIIPIVSKAQAQKIAVSTGSCTDRP